MSLGIALPARLTGGHVAAGDATEGGKWHTDPMLVIFGSPA